MIMVLPDYRAATPFGRLRGAQGRDVPPWPAGARLAPESPPTSSPDMAGERPGARAALNLSPEPADRRPWPVTTTHPARAAASLSGPRIRYPVDTGPQSADDLHQYRRYHESIPRVGMTYPLSHVRLTATRTDHGSMP